MFTQGWHGLPVKPCHSIRPFDPDFVLGVKRIEAFSPSDFQDEWLHMMPLDPVPTSRYPCTLPVTDRSQIVSCPSCHVTTYCVKTLIVAVWVSLCATDLVAPVQASPQLTEINSRNYTIYTDLSPSDVRPFARHMDTVFDQYKRRFRGFTSRDKRQMPLYLFQTQEGYLLFLASHGIDGRNTGGMFFVHREIQGLATFVSDGDRLHTLRTLQHEGFHQFAYALYRPQSAALGQ